MFFASNRACSCADGTVGERQRLLWDNAFISHVALGGIGRIEHFEKFHLGIGRVLEIDAAAPRLETLGFVDLRTSHRRVELSGKVEDAVPHHLRLHAPRIHSPQILILRIDGGVRRGCGPALERMRYALLVIISRWIAFMLQPLLTSSVASQSSSSG